METYGRAEKPIYAFFTSVLDARELSALRLGGFTGGKICPETYCIECYAFPGLVWKIWRREKSLILARN
jgi:hypothetical protein